MAGLWTPEREDELRKLIDSGLSGGAIGDRLGITRNAVLGKAMRLGLSVGGGATNYQEKRKAPPPRTKKVSLAPVSRAKASAPAPVLKAPVAPPKPLPAARPTSDPIPLLSRDTFSCAAIVGDAKASPAMCCGAPVYWRRDRKGVLSPSSWCRFHHELYTVVARPAPVRPPDRARTSRAVMK